MKYDNPYICDFCGGSNDWVIKSSIANNPCEIETKCTKCERKNYWAYGWYEREHPLREAVRDAVKKEKAAKK